MGKNSENILFAFLIFVSVVLSLEGCTIMFILIVYCLLNIPLSLPCQSMAALV